MSSADKDKHKLEEGKGADNNKPKEDVPSSYGRPTGYSSAAYVSSRRTRYSTPDKGEQKLEEETGADKLKAETDAQLERPEMVRRSVAQEDIDDILYTPGGSIRSSAADKGKQKLQEGTGADDNKEKQDVPSSQRKLARSAAAKAKKKIDEETDAILERAIMVSNLVERRELEGKEGFQTLPDRRSKLSAECVPSLLPILISEQLAADKAKQKLEGKAAASIIQKQAVPSSQPKKVTFAADQGKQKLEEAKAVPSSQPKTVTFAADKGKLKLEERKAVPSSQSTTVPSTADKGKQKLESGQDVPSSQPKTVPSAADKAKQKLEEVQLVPYPKPQTVPFAADKGKQKPEEVQLVPYPKPKTIPSAADKGKQKPEEVQLVPYPKPKTIPSAADKGKQKLEEGRGADKNLEKQDVTSSCGKPTRYSDADKGKQKLEEKIDAILEQERKELARKAVEDRRLEEHKRQIAWLDSLPKTVPPATDKGKQKLEEGRGADKNLEKKDGPSSRGKPTRSSDADKGKQKLEKKTDAILAQEREELARKAEEDKRLEEHKRWLTWLGTLPRKDPPATDKGKQKLEGKSADNNKEKQDVPSPQPKTVPSAADKGKQKLEEGTGADKNKVKEAAPSSGGKPPRHPAADRGKQKLEEGTGADKNKEKQASPSSGGKPPRYPVANKGKQKLEEGTGADKNKVKKDAPFSGGKPPRHPGSDKGKQKLEEGTGADKNKEKQPVSSSGGKPPRYTAAEKGKQKLEEGTGADKNKEGKDVAPAADKSKQTLEDLQPPDPYGLGHDVLYFRGNIVPPEAYRDPFPYRYHKIYGKKRPEGGDKLAADRLTLVWVDGCPNKWYSFHRNNWWPARILDEDSAKMVYKPEGTTDHELPVRLYGTGTLEYIHPKTGRYEIRKNYKGREHEYRRIFEEALKQELDLVYTSYTTKKSRTTYLYSDHMAQTAPLVAQYSEFMAKNFFPIEQPLYPPEAYPPKPPSFRRKRCITSVVVIGVIYLTAFIIVWKHYSP